MEVLGGGMKPHEEAGEKEKLMTLDGEIPVVEREEEEGLCLTPTSFSIE